MTDLFLSYAHRDVKSAETLARLLEANGLSVWWDRRLVAGDNFNQLIERQLDQAKAVIVLWSTVSVVSDWVLGEAQTARDANKLVPVKIEDCKLPIPYRGIHTPEVYKTTAELNRLAQILSEKLKPGTGARDGSTPAGPQPPLTFSTESSQTFAATLKSQFKNYHADWTTIRADSNLSFWEKTKQGFGLYKKYPWVLAILLVALGLEYVATQDAQQDPVAMQGLVTIVFVIGAVWLYRRYRSGKKS